MTNKPEQLLNESISSMIEEIESAPYRAGPYGARVLSALRELQERRKADSVKINDDMAYAFHHALSDSSLGADEVEEIKNGLRAAFANVAAPQPAKSLELAGWQFKSVNGDWLGLIDEHGKNQAVREGCEVREVFAIADSVNDREQVRREHAKWSQDTFGNVGPIGPLKHLSKEALEAAAEPGDLSEWADMQFLLWDAQRRAGISDEQITQAMVEKLAVNKQREWPEPKDGEPRLHIKAQPAMKDHQIRELVNDLRDIAIEYHGTQQLRERIARTVRAAMLQGEPQNSQQNIPKNIPAGNSPATPDGSTCKGCAEPKKISGNDLS